MILQDMGSQVLSQMFDDPKALAVAGLVLFIMGVIPGMPHFVFLSLALGSGIGAYLINHFRKQRPAQEEAEAEKEAEIALAEAEPKELGWNDVAPVDMIGLEVGYRLIPLVDKSQGGELLGRIKGVRKKLSQELGFLMPAVHIRDNLETATERLQNYAHGCLLAAKVLFTRTETSPLILGRCLVPLMESKRKTPHSV